jgi:hypothetical protein
MKNSAWQSDVHEYDIKIMSDKDAEPYIKSKFGLSIAYKMYTTEGARDVKPEIVTTPENSGENKKDSGLA